jgi:predicted transcriptional regulator
MCSAFEVPVSGRIPSASAKRNTSGGSDAESDLVLSVKPRWAYQILSGQKVVEIRRRFSTRWVDRSLSIYASEPERKIVGKAQIKAVVPGSPNDIWDVFGCDLACSRAEFDEYVKGCSEVFAIILENVCPYPYQVSVRERAFQPPPHAASPLHPQLGLSSTEYSLKAGGRSLPMNGLFLYVPVIVAAVVGIALVLRTRSSRTRGAVKYSFENRREPRLFTAEQTVGSATTDFYDARKEGQASSDPEGDELDPIVVSDSYVRRGPLLTASERAMLRLLRLELPHHEIFAHVRLADVINIHRKHRGFERRRRFMKISQDHLDFVVCDAQTNVVAAIELDDASHNTSQRARGDRLKDECLAAAGIPLKRFSATRLPRPDQVREGVFGSKASAEHLGHNCSNLSKKHCQLGVH